MDMEYVYAIFAIFFLCLIIFFKYVLLHCNQLHHHPTIGTMRMLRPGTMHPNIHVVSRTSVPYTITGTTISAFTLGPSAAPPPATLTEEGPYAPVYALQPRREQLIRESRRTAGRSMLTAHGPPDYDTVMAGRSNPAFVYEDLDDENLPSRTPPPSYESVIASMGPPRATGP